VLRADVRFARRLSRTDWAAVIGAAAVALGVEVGFRTLRLPTLARLVGAPLDPTPGIGPSSDDPLAGLGLSPGELRRLALTAAVVRRWPADAKCLRRSLVCGWRLRALHPRLVVGVAKVDGEIKAHAWLTVSGVSLDPAGSAEYAKLVAVGES
jgi:hypothetical protein